ncbi:hypothetical protein SUGI_0120040 [Cryptomeria japonica]|uniref:AP-3 complex subunit delta n=1 Tax=Cryptomeria japonica TaxID=3369 RepID=UPI002408E886|nr:AP-3 complex subunit delta [Cryptomeria japonica]GLJ10009.1 hypothetical protein SUGI_0120040 [Cryptomeria japonica]
MASTIMESFFQKSLEDLVKGLRVQMIGESRYLSKALDEIHKEIKSTDHETKAVALQKLTYLNMLQGFDMSWAAFHVVEVMSMPRFCHKKIGYLAASQSFKEDTEVLLLITNQLRKDLTSINEYEAGLALECLSRIATPDLARDLTPEIFTLLGSSKHYVKKKANLVLLRVFSKYPDAVRVAFKRLVENMESSDHHVSCTAVSVLCELTMKEPKAYLPLAPEFYRILVDSTNNWMLIKVVKVFGVLAPLEPRLAKKIVEPLCEHMHKTVAKSLLFECIRTVILGLTDHSGAVKLAMEKLKDLMQEDDPNLKYLGLQALGSLMPRHIWAVSENKEVIVKALSDADLSIQLASLRLVVGMITENNLVETIGVLTHYAFISDGEFCNEILGAILSTCSRNLYELVVDFGWYVTVLGDIARIPHCKHGNEVEKQLIDIGMRVKDVRAELLHVARKLLIDPALLEFPFLHRVLSAAAWIAGEYVEHKQDPFEIIEALLQPRTNLLPPAVRSVYLQSVLKVFVFYCYNHLKRSKAFVSESSLRNSGVPQEAQFLSSVIEPSIGAVDAKCNKTLKPAMSGLSSLKREIEIGCVKLNLEASSGGPQRGRPASKEIEIRRSLVDVGDEEDFDPRSSVAPADVFMGADSESTILTEDQAGIPENSGKEHVTQAAFDRLVELIKLNVSPLLESRDVEVQERARNLLGLLKALEDILGCLVEKQNSLQIEHIVVSQGNKAIEIIGCMHDIFAEELKPISVQAQGRVPVPDGITLKENLDDLVKILGDEQFIFDEGGESSIHKHREWDDTSLFSQCSKGEAPPIGESTSLLAQHRQRHGAFYLPTGKVEAKTDDYPPPHTLQNDVPPTSLDVSKDILKLAEQSFLSTKPQQTRTKVRPVVVRLEEGDDMPVLANKQVKDLKDDFISNAIKDVLTGDKNKHLVRSDSRDQENLLKTSSVGHRHRSGRRSESSSRREDNKGVKFNDNFVDVSKGSMDCVEEQKTERQSTSRHKHSRHGKKAYKDPVSDSEERDGHKGRHQRHSKKENNPHTKHRSRQRAESPLQVAPQTAIIPDFLL